MVGLLGRDDGCVGRKHEMDTRVGHQVGLELGNIHVQGSVETKRGRQGRDDLSNQPVEVGVCGTLNVEVTTAHIVESLVVNTVGTVRVLEKSMGRQHGVVRLNHGGGHLRRR